MVMPSVAWKMSAVYVVLYADGPSGVVRTFPVSVATRGSLRAYNAEGMKDPYSRGLSRATATKELVLLGSVPRYEPRRSVKLHRAYCASAFKYQSSMNINFVVMLSELQ